MNIHVEAHTRWAPSSRACAHTRTCTHQAEKELPTHAHTCRSTHQEGTFVTSLCKYSCTRTCTHQAEKERDEARKAAEERAAELGALQARQC